MGIRLTIGKPGPGIAAAPSTPGTGLVIPLYPAGTPGSLGVVQIRERSGRAADTIIGNVSVPTLALFCPAAGHANGTAVIVGPGGGFGGLEYDTDGTAAARRPRE